MIGRGDYWGGEDKRIKVCKAIFYYLNEVADMLFYFFIPFCMFHVMYNNFKDS